MQNFKRKRKVSFEEVTVDEFTVEEITVESLKKLNPTKSVTIKTQTSILNFFKKKNNKN